MDDQEGHGGYRMTTITTIEIEPPYLLFIGDMDYELDAKTAFGIAHWRPELCLAQLRFVMHSTDAGMMRAAMIRDMAVLREAGGAAAKKAGKDIDPV